MALNGSQPAVPYRHQHCSRSTAYLLWNIRTPDRSILSQNYGPILDVARHILQNLLPFAKCTLLKSQCAFIHPFIFKAVLTAGYPKTTTVVVISVIIPPWLVVGCHKQSLVFVRCGPSSIDGCQLLEEGRLILRIWEGMNYSIHQCLMIRPPPSLPDFRPFAR